MVLGFGGIFQNFGEGFGVLDEEIRGFGPFYKVLGSAQNRLKNVQRDRASFGRVRAGLSFLTAPLFRKMIITFDSYIL